MFFFIHYYLQIWNFLPLSQDFLVISCPYQRMFASRRSADEELPEFLDPLVAANRANEPVDGYKVRSLSRAAAEKEETKKRNRVIIESIVIGFLVGLAVVLIWIFVLRHHGSNSNSNNDDDASPSYHLWCIGNCDQDVTTTTIPGVVMMGGGNLTEPAFEWQIEHANKGDFVILVIEGTDHRNQYVYDLSQTIGYPLNSVTTISFEKPQASYDETVIETIRSAEAIFILGGDQTEDMSFWRGTPIQSLLQLKSETVTIGGTSAGCMILGNYIYSDTNITAPMLTSEEAMENPYNYLIDIVPKFLTLPYLETVLLDTHFGKYF